MQISPQLISLIVSGVALFFILAQFLLGAIRGLKKSTFRLVWVLVWGILCLIFSGIIAKALVNINIEFLHLSVNGETASTLPQYIQMLMASSNEDVAQMMTDNPKIFELCTQIAISVLNLVFFEVLFWVVKWLLWPIWAILARVFFKKKKYVYEEETGKTRLSNQKKHGFLGALVGIGTGLVIAIFAFMPVAGLTNAIIALDQATTIEYDGATQPGIVTQNAGEYLDYIYAYKNSYFAKGLKYTGLETVQNAGVKVLTTTNFEGNKINLEQEINTFSPIYVGYNKLSNYDYENLSKTDVGEILTIADDLQKAALSSKILESVYDEVVPYLVKNVLTNDEYFIQIPSVNNQDLDNMIKDSLRALFGITADNQIDQSKVIKMDDIKNDISCLIDIARDFNDADIMLDLINGTATTESIQQKLTEQLGRDLVDHLYQTTIFVRLTPVVVEPLIKFGIEAIPQLEVEEGVYKSITYTALADGIKTDDVKELMQTIVGKAILVYKNVDFENNDYVEKDMLDKVGAILDNLTNGKIISAQTIASAKDYLKTFANQKLDNVSLPEDVKNVAKQYLEGIIDITNYEAKLPLEGGIIIDFMDSQIEDFDSLKTFVQTKLLDSDGNSKSEILTNDMIYDLMAGYTDELNLGIENINADLKAQLQQDKTDKANLNSVLNQVENLLTKIDEMKTIPSTDEIDRAYVVGLGVDIDRMTTDYSLVINADAKAKIGDYVALQFKDAIVNDSDIPEPTKLEVVAHYEARASYASYEDLFTAFANDLQLEE